MRRPPSTARQTQMAALLAAIVAAASSEEDELMREPKCKLFGYAPDGSAVHVQRYPFGVEARHYAKDCNRTARDTEPGGTRQPEPEREEDA